MKKKVFAFILCLPASLFSIYFGFLFSFLGGAFGSIISAVSDGSNIGNIFVIFSYLCILGGLIGFIGSFFSFKKPKAALIIILIATLLCGLLYSYILYNVMITGSIKITLLLIDILPLLFFILSIILLVKAKKITNNENNTNINSQN